MSIGIPRIRDANTEAITETRVLVVGDAYHQILDPSGSGREVDLPNGTTSQGAAVMITNAADGGSEDLTIKQSDSSTTITVIAQDESQELVCNGDGAAKGWQTTGLKET